MPDRGHRQSPTRWPGVFRGAVLWAIAAGVVVPVLMPRDRCCRFPDLRAAATIQMSNIGQTLENHLRREGTLPATLAALTKSPPLDPHPYLRNLPPDPWGNEVTYEPHDDGSYLLRSFGEDGVPDTEDDLVWPLQDGT